MLKEKEVYFNLILHKVVNKDLYLLKLQMNYLFNKRKFL